jgi:hypothetical protein
MPPAPPLPAARMPPVPPLPAACMPPRPALGPASTSSIAPASRSATPLLLAAGAAVITCWPLPAAVAMGACMLVAGEACAVAFFDLFATTGGGCFAASSSGTAAHAVRPASSNNTLGEGRNCLRSMANLMNRTNCVTAK